MRNLHVTLRQDHERLERLFQALVDAVEAGDMPAVSTIWGEFERGLLGHLEFEEVELFPLLEADHRDTISALRLEHEEIRRLLGDLGIRADLHTLRRDVAETLIAKLRAHAALEDRTIYPRAESLQPEVAEHRLLDVFQAAVGRREAPGRTSPIAGR